MAEGNDIDEVAKCEFFNPGGSVKDRIGYRMVLDAEKQGLLTPGLTTIIEPTSGNTGIGLALACAVQNYKCIIVMPEKMSEEKQIVLRSLGATIVRTPTTAAFDSPEGIIAVSQKLQNQIPNSIILNQYENPGNPTAHYDLTAMEIYTECEGKIDAVIIGAGTGGTISGVGRKLKELCPKCLIVGVDPETSILAQKPVINEQGLDIPYYEVEGIGYDFIPTVLDLSVVDLWVKVDDKMSFAMARRMMREEALLCGGSSGAALSAALLAVKDFKADQRVVIVLPDGIRNYLSKFVQDSWMQARNFMSCENTENHAWWNLPLKTLKLSPPPSVRSSQTCQQALDIMKKSGIEQVPILGDSGEIIGVATATNVVSAIVGKRIRASDKVDKAILRHYTKVSADSILGLAYRILEKNPYVVVVRKNAETTHENVVGLITMIDFLEYVPDSNNDGNNLSAEKVAGICEKLQHLNSSEAGLNHATNGSIST